MIKIIKRPNDTKNNTIYYFCDSCFNLVKITSRFKTNGSITVRGKNFDILVKPNTFDGYVNCSKCDNVMDEIDKDLAVIIQRFNKKGYETLFCCQGHVYSKDQNNIDQVEFAYLVLDLVNQDRIDFALNLMKKFNKIKEYIRIEPVDTCGKIPKNINAKLFRIGINVGFIDDANGLDEFIMNEIAGLNKIFLDFIDQLSIKIRHAK